MKLVCVFIATGVLQEEKIAGNIAEYYILSFLKASNLKAILYWSKVVSFPWRCDWSITHTPPSQPIRYNTKTKWLLVTRVFLQFRQLCISWSLGHAGHLFTCVFPHFRQLSIGYCRLRLKRLTQIADNIPENIFV